MKHLIKSLLTATFAFFSFTSGAQYAHSVWLEGATLGTEANCFIADINGNGFLLGGYLAYDSAAIYHVDNMGVEDWRKTFYNAGHEITFYNLIHTQDGNYAAIGSKNYDGVVTTDCSAWLVKLDDAGSVIWEKTFGGSTSDVLYDVKQTADGGYIGVGKTNSANIPGYHSNYDMWIVKLDSNGDIEWQKAFGGTADDEGASVIQTAGGEFVALATTGSDDGDISTQLGLVGTTDIWLVKFDNTGNIVWEKSYGGSLDEGAGNLIASDTTFMVLGHTHSNNGHISFNHGASDAWVLRLDTSGTILWEKCYGGSSYDGAIRGSIKETTPGRYTITSIAAGLPSGGDGDLQCAGFGGWLFNIDSVGNFNWGWQYGGAPMGVEFNSGSYITGGTYFPWPGITSQYWVARVQEINIVTCEPTLDVDNTSGKEKQIISVYPTVTNGKINVDIPATYTRPVIVITDVMGRSVPVQQTSSGSKHEVLIEGISAGIYYLTVTGDHGTETFKVVYQP